MEGPRSSDEGRGAIWEGGRQREQQAQKWEDKSGLERQAQREVEKGSDKDEIHSHG